MRIGDDHLTASSPRIALPDPHSREGGFTLIEMLIALLILTFGLLAAGQLMYIAAASASLARSKSSAAMVAQNKLEYLADLFRQNASAADLTVGSHGPEQVQINNPLGGSALNRFNVAWAVSIVPDPRAGKVLAAKQVTVTITPIGSGTSANSKRMLNKIISVTAIFSARLL